MLFILWPIFGALVARYRLVLRGSHITCLVWGILVEVTPWPCPLTVLDKWLELGAGVESYQGGSVLHYLDKVVYPDISPTLLTVVGVSICVLNLGLDGRTLLVGCGRWR